VQELERSLEAMRARAEEAEIECGALEREFRKDAERQAGLLQGAEEGKHSMEMRVADLRGRLASAERRRADADTAAAAAQAEAGQLKAAWAEYKRLKAQRERMEQASSDTAVRVEAATARTAAAAAEEERPTDVREAKAEVRVNP
jgi:hypothetical protein